MKRTRFGPWVVLAVLLVWASAAMAGKPVPDVHCQAEKNVAAGDYLNCRLRADGDLLKTGDPARYDLLVGVCDDQLRKTFALVEAQATVPCVTMGDAEEMIAFLGAYADNVSMKLSGATVAVCGNGVVEPGEDCDWNALGMDPMNPGNVASCGSATHGWLIYGDLKCAPGCVLDISDCHTACPGVEYEGACWVLGEMHETCDTVCSKHRGVYSELTRTFVGDLGTDENCAMMLDWLGVEGTGVVATEIPPQPNAVDYGIGCIYWHGMDAGRFRVTFPPTSPRATIPEHVEIHRLCGCVTAY